LTIIEVDGVNTEPLVVNEIQIFVGQRYSFILEASQPVDNYWIRSNPNSGIVGFDGGLNSAVLRYIGSNATADPITNQTSNVTPLVESDLVPLSNPAAPGTPEVGGADVLLNLDLGFNASTLDFTINGVTFVSPSVPVLLQILSGKMAATDLLPAGSVYTLPRNKVVELSMPAGVAGGPVSTAIRDVSNLCSWNFCIAPISFAWSKHPNIVTMHSFSLRRLFQSINLASSEAQGKADIIMSILLSGMSSLLEQQVITSPFGGSPTTQARGTCIGMVFFNL
jgi:hypothetical protein